MSLFAVSADSISASVGAAVAIAAFTMTGVVRPLSRRARANLERSLETEGNLRELHHDVQDLLEAVREMSEIQRSHEARISRIEVLWTAQNGKG